MDVKRARGESDVATRGWVMRIGQEELIIDQRYEALSIVNDILIGAWFLVGSILFFFPAHADTGVWLFVLGSAEMLIRPTIRLARRIHIRRVRQHVADTANAGYDF